jgi:hypothetical protein
MGNKSLRVRFNIKQPSFGRNPTKPVLTILSHSNGIQQGEEWGKIIHLPIMSRYEKVNSPLIGGTKKLQMVRHISILKTGNAKQVRKRCLKSLSPTSNIMPKTNFRAIPHLKSSVARQLPIPPNIISEPHPMRPMNLVRTPPTPNTAIFKIYNHPP